MNIEKEKRIEEILLSLKKCDFLTREQLQKMHGLGGDRNAQRILSDMAEYVNFFFEDKRKIYYLNAVGRDRVQANKVRKKTAQVHHFLMRNDLYIHLGRPATWKNEVKISVNTETVIADAVFQHNKLYYFIEIDYKQSMSKNVSKIKRYKQLAESNSNFTLIWVTTTPYQKKKLESLCTGLSKKVYMWNDLK